MIPPKSGNAKYPISHPIINKTTISQIKSFISVGCLAQHNVAINGLDFKKINVLNRINHIVSFQNQISRLVILYEFIQTRV